jgi:hypothetical protein
MYSQQRLQRYFVVGAFTWLLFQPFQPPLLARNLAETSVAQSSSKKNYFEGFLIHGTVFDDKALAFPSVELRIRRAGEKKFRWETYTNSRGDFAVRVPKGTDYEIVVHAKGFTDQTQAIDAKIEDEKLLSFRMEPSAGGKK